MGGDGHNINGTTYALTVMTAIMPGRTEEVRAYIEGLPRGEDAPIARLGIVHTSRLQIFDSLVYQGEPQVRDRLKNDYLIFTAAFDGDDLWVTTFDPIDGSTAVWRIDPSSGIGRDAGRLTTGDDPIGVAYDGASVWVTAAGSDRILRFVP